MYVGIGVYVQWEDCINEHHNRFNLGERPPGIPGCEIVTTEDDEYLSIKYQHLYYVICKYFDETMAIKILKYILSYAQSGINDINVMVCDGCRLHYRIDKEFEEYKNSILETCSSAVRIITTILDFLGRCDTVNEVLIHDNLREQLVDIGVPEDLLNSVLYDMGCWC
jgi:hypothetical protein